MNNLSVYTLLSSASGLKMIFDMMNVIIFYNLMSQANITYPSVGTQQRTRPCDVRKLPVSREPSLVRKCPVSREPSVVRKLPVSREPAVFRKLPVSRELSMVGNHSQ